MRHRAWWVGRLVVSSLALAGLAPGCGSSGGSRDAASPDAASHDAASTIDANVDAALSPEVDAGLSAFANEMLTAHNAVRAGATPAPSPALDPLGWSDAAAATADAWAQGCQFMHNPSAGFGENIYAASGTSSPSDVVASWASEVSSYDYGANTCAGTCGHYTQIVWRDTTAVGCAAATCTTNSPFGSGSWYFVVCDYDPPGNFVGRRPY